MSYIDYISKIAQTDKSRRLDAIKTVLDENRIGYIEQTNGDVNNLIVARNETKGDRIVIGAHYDNFPGTPGANDNASACSILLNLILNLKDTDLPLDFVFFDGEERGLLGSKYFLQTTGTQDIQAVINMDMCGLGSNTLISTHNFTDNVSNELPFARLFSDNFKSEYKLLKRLPTGDADTFIQAGIPTVYVVNSTDRDVEWFGKYARGEYPHGFPDFAMTMHRPNDTPETVNMEQIEKIYSLLFGMLCQNER